ncbi:MAG: flippase [Bacteroidota bacterium]
MSKSWLSNLRSSAGFQKYLQNISWLMGGKLLQMAISFLVTAYVARYLQDQAFGTLNYSKAIIQFVFIFVGLGLQSINVRNLVNSPEQRGEILGTALVARLLIGLMLAGLVVGGTWLLPESIHDSLTNSLILVMAVSAIFKTMDTFEEFFQAEVKSQYAVWSRSLSTIVFAGIQLYLIYIKAELIWFGVAFSIRNAINGIAYFVLYVRYYGWPQGLHWEAGYFRQLMLDAWPMIFSGMVIFLYMRADQMMLMHLIPGSDEMAKAAVGQYSAALRLSEVWFVFGPIVAGGLFPAILSARKQGIKIYEHRLKRYFSLMVALAFAISIPTALFGPTVLVWDWLFGPDYAEAAEVLVLHCWTLVFVFLGNASSNYLVAENLQRITLYRTLLGAVLNISLNWWLIPTWGIKGAAIATLISQAFASYLSYAFHPRTRRLFRMMSGAFLLQALFQSKLSTS